MRACLVLLAAAALAGGCAHERSSSVPMPPQPDPCAAPLRTLREVIPPRFRSLADVQRGIAAIESWQYQTGDPRAPYASAYAVATATVMHYHDRGHFEDARWAERYYVALSNRYCAALLGYETGRADECPPAWRVTFDAAAQGDPSPLRHLLLGAASNLLGDSPVALVDAGMGPDRALRLRDHRAYTSVALASIGPTQDRIACLYAPHYAGFDQALGPLDEAITRRQIRRGRERAWQNAIALTGAPGADARAEVVRHIESEAAARACRILRMPLPFTSVPRHERVAVHYQSDGPTCSERRIRAKEEEYLE